MPTSVCDPITGPPPEIDLNTDLGEGFGVWSVGDDEALLSVATSANVACGFHAGDPTIMRRVCAAAAARGVAVGAHVSYPDLRGFGRRAVDCPPAEIEADVIYQIGALRAAAGAEGTTVSHVKAHGALYHRVAADPVAAAALVDACRLVDRALVVVCPPGSRLHAAAVEAGLGVVTEGFADRGYTASGALAPRGTPGAILHDPDLVADRCVRMVTRGEVVSTDGRRVGLQVGTLCLHSDTPGAVRLASRVRAALEAAGVRVRSYAAPRGDRGRG